MKKEKNKRIRRIKSKTREERFNERMREREKLRKN